MRKAVFVPAMLASLLISTAALAQSRGEMIREQVLAKQSEGFGRPSRGDFERAPREAIQRIDRMSPRGEIYGADRGGMKTTTTGAGSSQRNLSATGGVNTPSEIRAMKRVINPMYGAYRTSQAQDGTDSYGGESLVPNGKGQGQGTTARNLSATGGVNTPSEIRAMKRVINPMHGAYRTSQAPDGTDSYGGESLVPNGKGEGQGKQRNLSASGATNTPREIRAMRSMINPMSPGGVRTAAGGGTDSYGNDTPYVAPKNFAAQQAPAKVEKAPAKDPSETRR
jgi:hypothetical protein